MNLGKKLAISAVVGILGAAAALGSARAGATAASSGEAPRADKSGCGKHDGGKCGSMMTKEAVPDMARE